MRKTPVAGGSGQIHLGQCFELDANGFEEPPDCDRLSFDGRLAMLVSPRRHDRVN
jgi:hypothetical protein